jgi:hypothetical protein
MLTSVYGLWFMVHGSWFMVYGLGETRMCGAFESNERMLASLVFQAAEVGVLEVLHKPSQQSGC